MKPTTRMRWFAVATACSLLASAGCPPMYNAAERQRRSNMLRAIGLAYHSLNDETGKAPAGPDELAPYLNDFPQALQYLKSGEVVFLYSVPIKNLMANEAGLSQTVLAYEKDVPARGGLVLMADGATQSMSPDEFNKAAKAG